MLEGWGDFSSGKQKQFLRLGVVSGLMLLIAVLFWQILAQQGTFSAKQDYAAVPTSALLLVERPGVTIFRQGSMLTAVLSGMLLQAGDRLQLERGGHIVIDFLNGDRLAARNGSNETEGGSGGSLSINLLALGRDQQRQALAEELGLSAGEYWLTLRGKVKVGQAVLATPLAEDGQPSANQPATFAASYDQTSGMLGLRVFGGGLAVSQASGGGNLPVVAGEQLTWYTESAVTNADIAELSLPLNRWEQENLQLAERQLYQQAVAAEDEEVKAEAAQTLALYQAYLQGDVAEARELSGLTGRSAIRHYLNLMPANQFDFTNVVQASPPAIREVLKGELSQGEGVVAQVVVPAMVPVAIPTFVVTEKSLSINLQSPILHGQQGDNLVALWYFLPLRAGGAVYIEEVPTLGQADYQLVFPLAAKPAFFPVSGWPTGEYLVRVLWRGQVLAEKNFRVASS